MTAKLKPKRLKPSDRRSQILQAAIRFFSDEGFDGSTRTLANRLGITQPLIYRYFPAKSDLIKEVYETVFAGRWRHEWEAIVLDRSVPIRKRISAFYIAYTDVVFERDWIRIYLFSGLRGLQINQWWSSFVEDHIFRMICNELRHEFGLPSVTASPPSAAEIEMFWAFQGAIFYYAMRRDIYRAKVHLEFPQYMDTVIDSMLASAGEVMRANVRPLRGGPKTIKSKKLLLRRKRT